VVVHGVEGASGRSPDNAAPDRNRADVIEHTTMNATSPEPHDHHHAMSHAPDMSDKGHEQRGTTGHAGHGEPGAHDRHAGHSVAMFRDKFWITLLLSIPTLLWSGMVQHMLGFSAPTFRGQILPALSAARLLLRRVGFVRWDCSPGMKPGMMT
jgi:hypothetical protein